MPFHGLLFAPPAKDSLGATCGNTLLHNRPRTVPQPITPLLPLCLPFRAFLPMLGTFSREVNCHGMRVWFNGVGPTT